MLQGQKNPAQISLKDKGFCDLGSVRVGRGRQALGLDSASISVISLRT